MPRKLFQLLTKLVVGTILVLVFGSQPLIKTVAEPETFASPVHAGCYLERADRCKIHVEPIRINLATGERLVRFQLVARRAGSSTQTTIYDFRPDVSNPLPVSGNVIPLSPVAKDFAATCGQTYSVSLLGQDTGDSGLLNLGATAEFTCPEGTYRQMVPMIVK